MSATLRVHDPSGAVTWSCDIPEAGLIIGRDPSCTLTLDHPALSRRHAHVWAGASGVQVKDLGSANGTWVGEQRVQQVALTSGQPFRLGQLMLSVEVGASPRVAETLIVDSGQDPRTPVAFTPPPVALSAPIGSFQPASPAFAEAQTVADPNQVAGRTPIVFQAPASPVSFQPAPAAFQPPPVAVQPPPAPAPLQPQSVPAPLQPRPAPLPMPGPPRQGPEPRRRWGFAALWMLLGLGGAAALLFFTGWADDAWRLYQGELVAGEAPVSAPAELPTPQAFEEPGA